jgi:hypothetical protein
VATSVSRSWLLTNATTRWRVGLTTAATASRLYAAGVSFPAPRMVSLGPITDDDAGYVLRERRGRRNRYQVVPELPLRHPLVREQEVGELLEPLLRSGGPATARPG